MKKHLYLVLFAITLCTISCKKDKKEVKDFSNEALTNGSWRPVLNDNNSTTNPSTGVNVYQPVLNCQKDDVYTYRQNGELLVDNGSTVCTSDEPAARQTYTIDGANKKLTVSGVTYTILELNTTRLKYSRPVPLPSGISNIIYLFERP